MYLGSSGLDDEAIETVFCVLSSSRAPKSAPLSFPSVRSSCKEKEGKRDNDQDECPQLLLYFNVSEIILSTLFISFSSSFVRLSVPYPLLSPCDPISFY